MFWSLGCSPAPETDVAWGADALYDATYAFTSIGPRQVGTAGEAAAHAAAVGALSALDPSSEPFVFDAWRPGSASITVDGETVAVEALSPTGPADVTLVLQDEAGDLGGTAAVLSSEDGDRAASLFTALGGGAAALIRVTDELDFDGGPLTEVGHILDGITLPAVATDRPTGDWLRAHLGRPARLLVAPDIAYGHVSRNVVARIAPRAPGAAQVFVVGHYDSWHPSESAFDNALGVGALGLLARRAAAAGPPEHEIVFIATSGEEQGLKGASAWAAAHDDEVGPGDVVIVLDVMWSAEGTYRALATRDDLLEDAIDATREAGLPAVRGGDPGLGSDHVPFVVRGAEAIWVGRWPDRHYHTAMDTIGALDFDEAALTLDAAWLLVASRAGLAP